MEYSILGAVRWTYFSHEFLAKLVSVGLTRNSIYETSRYGNNPGPIFVTVATRGTVRRG